MKPYAPVPIMLLCGLILLCSPPARAQVRIIHDLPADTLWQQAQGLLEAFEFAEAHPLFIRAAARYAAQQQWRQYYACQHKIAHCLWRNHRGAAAVTLCRKMLKEVEENLHDADPLRAGFHTILGNFYADRRTQNAFAQSLAHFDTLLQLTRQHYGDAHPQLASVYDRFGIAYYLIDDYPTALSYYEKAIALLPEPTPTDVHQQALIYNHLGMVYRGQGAYRLALQQFVKAKNMVEQIGGTHNSQLTRNLIDMAHVLLKLGDYQQALHHLEEAKTIELQISRKKDKMMVYVLGGLGDTYLAKQDYGRAAMYFEQCLAHWDAKLRDDVNGRMVDLTKLGTCLLRLGHLAKARQRFEEVLELLACYYDPDDENWVQALLNMGLLHQQERSFSQAENYLLRAWQIVRQKKEQHPSAGTIYTHLATLYAHTKRWDQSLHWIRKAKAAYRRPSPEHLPDKNSYAINDLPAYIQTMTRLGSLEKQYYDFSGNLAYLQQSAATFRAGLAAADQLSLRLPDVPALQEVQEALHTLSDRALQSLRMLWEQSCDPIYTAEVFHYFEKSKSGGLGQLTREQHAKISAHIPAAVLDHEQLLKTRMVHYQNAIRQHTADTLSLLATVWQKKLYRLQQQLRDHQQYLDQAYPAYQRLRSKVQPSSLAEVQSFFQKERAEAVTYFWGEQQLHILAIGSDQTEWVIIDDPHRMQDQLVALHDLIQKGSATWKTDQDRQTDFMAFVQLSRTLYAQLIPELIRHERDHRLIVIPDGPLEQFPFTALLTSAPPPAALAEINYRSLPYLARFRPLQLESAAHFLIGPAPRPSGVGYLGFAPAYPTETATGAWQELLQNQNEVMEASQLVQGQMFLGAEATEEVFKTEAGKAQILHLAMHARWHPAEFDRSLLAFAKKGPSPEDGLLHTYELYALPLRAELAILSACYTGKGVLQKGEGILSISRAFRYAGCPAVVLNLWQADDVANKAIVLSFLQYLKEGKDKSEALQRTVQDYLANARHDRQTHPFYWSGIVLSGRNDAMAFRRPVSKHWHTFNQYLMSLWPLT